MEGVPDASFGPLAATAPAAAARRASPAGQAGHDALAWIGERVPGVVLAAATAYLAVWLADWLGRDVLGFASSPLNGIPLAILLGLALGNTIGVPEIFHAGLRVCMVQLQRLAIILLGLRLSLGAAGAIGLEALPVIAVCVATALVLVPWIGRSIGLAPRLATLIAVGTGICGVSAIMATAPAIDAKKDEISYAVACVAIFGVLSMMIYPYVVPFLVGTDPHTVGLFLGTAIHDTAQVTGAALTYQQLHDAPEVLGAATVVKLVRNLSMVLVIPLMAVLFHSTRAPGRSVFQGWRQAVPFFVFGFVGMTIVRTIGDAGTQPFGVLDPATWRQFLRAADATSIWLLTAVMAAIGLNTGLAQLRRLGWKPFVVGLAAALTLGAVSLAIIKLRAAQ
jgi:uncharacterized integral membrane protein (TIGR00698 family)